MKGAICLLSLCVIVGLVNGYGEPSSSGGPVWQERANHYFVNAVRIAPTQYKTIYMAGYSPNVSSILGSTYKAVAPLYMVPQLVASSEAHSTDMATTNTFSHSSSDGTDVFTRIESYYTCSGTMGENIAAGLVQPLDTNNQWLCDETGSACAADGSGSDGHRSNIMDSSYLGIGVGYAYATTDTYKYLWTQDFGGSTCPPNPTNPIYSGSHYTPSTGNTKFVSIFYSTAAATSASVVVGSTSYTLSLELGSAAEGAFVSTQKAGTACRSYYFTFVANSVTYRYPDTGCLVTYGEGSCVTSFDASCSGSATVAAATTAATTATTSTTAATTSASSTTTAKAATTSTSTTAKAATTAATTAASTTTAKATTGTGSTTGSSSVYYIYSTSLQNGWSIVTESSSSKTSSVTFLGQTALSVVLTASSGSSYFLEFTHSSTVSTSGKTKLVFNVVGSVAGSIAVFPNGGQYVTVPVTTSWVTQTIALSSLGSPATIGPSNGLVFANTGVALDLYLYNVELV